MNSFQVNAVLLITLVTCINYPYDLILFVPPLNVNSPLFFQNIIPFSIGFLPNLMYIVSYAFGE